MKRYLILASGFLMQMCLGATYAWSVFVPPLRGATGLSQGVTQSPFTVFYFAFPLTLLSSGTLSNRLGPRRAAVLGTILFGSGWVLAGLAGPISFAFVLLGVGLLAGAGVGVAYIVPITVGNRWFPRQPGLVTGIGVAGFAIGAALVGLGAEGLMVSRGSGPFDALALVGVGCLLVGVPAALQMTYPDGGEATSSSPPRRRDVVRSEEFRQLFPAMLAGLAAGFAVNANLKDLSPAGVPGAGVAAVSAFAIANAVGRIGWGWVFDRMRPSSAIRWNLLAQAAVLSGVAFLVRDLPSLLAGAALAGFNYGGVLVLYASTVARRWGLQNMGHVYGLLFTANIMAAPAPMVAGFSLDVFGAFTPAFLLFAALAVVTAALVSGSVNRTPGQEQATDARPQLPAGGPTSLKAL